MFIRKISTMLLSLLLLSLMAIGTVSAVESNKTIDYVALGDSLAAGQKPTAIGSTSAKLYGTSYPKFIRDDLSSNGLLNSFANFGVSGYETWNVSNDLMTTGSIPARMQSSRLKPSHWISAPMTCYPIWKRKKAMYQICWIDLLIWIRPRSTI